MAVCLGVDTSNYTTSTALYDLETGAVRQEKRLLPVKEGAVGQRQSDAVFGHVKALGGLLETLLAEGPDIRAVGVSAKPRDEEGSYMPCFLAGEMAARSMAAALGVPLYPCSHQAGHVAAALYGAGKLELTDQSFLAFHVSGGTTDCLLVRPGGQGDDPRFSQSFQIKALARSLDLHAGQAVDRVGARLGLPFPAGPALETLAATSDKDYQPRPAMKGMDCCLSGLENQCARLLEEGVAPADVAKYCLCSLREVLSAMAEKALEAHPGLPVLFAGGVMSNSFLQRELGGRFPGSFFSPPAYSADNAAGVAILAALRHRKEAPQP